MFTLKEIPINEKDNRRNGSCIIAEVGQNIRKLDMLNTLKFCINGCRCNKISTHDNDNLFLKIH